MPRSRGHGRSSKAGRHANKKSSQPNDSPTNPCSPHKNTATVENAKDPPIHTSNQRKENLAIILNAPLDEYVMDETPHDQLKTNTIDQKKQSPIILAGL